MAKQRQKTAANVIAIACYDLNSNEREKLPHGMPIVFEENRLFDEDQGYPMRDGMDFSGHGYREIQEHIGRRIASVKKCRDPDGEMSIYGMEVDLYRLPGTPERLWTWLVAWFSDPGNHGFGSVYFRTWKLGEWTRERLC